MTTAAVALGRPAVVPPERSRRLYPRRTWAVIVAVYGALVVGIPALHLLVPASSAFHLSDYTVTLVGKILCYATVALALDLVWGYTGILSLGHGLFFALGGYAMGMYLMRAIGRDGVYGDPVLPDFMVFLDWKELPWFWLGSDRFFSIITQALTYAAMLLFFRNQTGFGGNNGFTDFKRILGFPLASPHTRVVLLVLSATLLLAVLALCRALVLSKLGRVLTAIRDAEDRVRFCGYDPVSFKLFVWTLSAVICGIAGALYVPQVGIINPGEMSPANSVEIAIAVALGGRGTLLGPILGAGLLHGAKSVLTVAFPQAWLFVLGIAFIAVTRWLPRGVLGLVWREGPP